MSFAINSNLTALHGLTPAVCSTHIPIPTSPTDHFPSDFSTRYEIFGELSRGGCGVILKAHDKRLRRDVLIKKIVDPKSSAGEIRERFIHEARITAQLAHPGIVPIHDLGIDPADSSDEPYYVMKWIHGETLQTALDRLRAEPKHTADRIRNDLLHRFNPICDTVAFAHSRGIIHRDLKPANILLGDYQETVILDWGLAKKIELKGCRQSKSVDDEVKVDLSESLPYEDHLSPFHTSVGSVIGTAAYMSPEQAQGKIQNLDSRSDVYSLGIILYEIITGEQPFHCDTWHETIEHVSRSEFKPVLVQASRTPKPLAAICEKALQLDATKRYPSALELQQDIQSFLRREKVSAYRERIWETADRCLSRHRGAVWISFLSLTCLTIALLLTNAEMKRARDTERQLRIIAENEHAAKTEALECEQIAHREAISQLQDAREAIDSWFVGLDYDLSKYPGLHDLRQQMLGQAELHYKRLSSNIEDSPLMNLEEARAMIRLGEIELSTGHIEPSSIAFQNAIAQIEKSNTPAYSDWYPIEQTQLAAAKIGLAAAKIESGRECDRAIDLLNTAKDYLTSIGPDSRLFDAVQYLLAREAFVEATLYAVIEKNHPAAIESYKRAAVYLEGNKNGKHPWAHNQLRARTLEELAKIYTNDSNFAPANLAYQRLVEFYDELIGSGHNRPDWLESRAQAKLQSAMCLSQLLQTNDAISSFEAAEYDLRKAWDAFSGSATFHDKVSIVYNGLGLSLLLSGDYAHSESILRMSLNSLEQISMHANDPKTQESILERKAQDQIWLFMSVWNQSKDFTPEWEKTIQIKNEFQSSIPSDQQLPLLNFQFAWLETLVLIEQGKIDDAIRVIDRALEQIDSMTNEPRIPSDYRDLYVGRFHQNRAHCLLLLGKDDAARDQVALARSAWERCMNSKSRPAGMATFASIQSFCEDPNASRSELLGALRLAQKMVQQHASSPTAWYWLAECSYRCANPVGAENAMRKVERLRSHLTTDDLILRSLIQSGNLPDSFADPAYLRTERRFSHSRILIDRFASKSN